MKRMITVGVIRSGEKYLSRHLRKNDYWAEGETIEGEWIGIAAKTLGLEGSVSEKPFEALRQNRHPSTGEPLSPRDAAQRVAFFDIQLSAPKDASVLAIVGSDDRVREAFVQSVRETLSEMERYAAVRERRGKAAASEDFRLTGNFAGAMFVHDASRDLDPQLHAHAVLANVTFDPVRKQWMALQPAEMLRASPYLRQVLYREFAARLRSLGYDVYDQSALGFSIRGVEHLRERFSKRSAHVQKLADEFAKEKGRRPSKKEFEILVRESREAKLAEISTAEVRRRQRSELTQDETRNLEKLVAGAKVKPPQTTVSVGEVSAVIESAFRHVYERASVAREGAVLGAALALHPHFSRWRELRAALENHPQALRREGEMTLRSIREEETRTVKRAEDGRNTRFALGKAEALAKTLTEGQRSAAQHILASRDAVTVLVGDAGTGKTTVLKEIESAHCAQSGRGFIALAPTTRARDGLAESGFAETDTVQRFTVLARQVPLATDRVILVDEAGLLSTGQLDELTRLADEQHARLLLVGDIKQHHSVERGDALRNVIQRAGLPIVRLSEVLRQRSPADRRFSRLLADGANHEAFAYADRRGMIREIPDEEKLFGEAAAQAVSNRQNNVETLVVIPFWSEVERYDEAVRPRLRQAGFLGETEVERGGLRLLSWTAEEKGNWRQYRTDHRILFVRTGTHFTRGESWEILEVTAKGLWIRDRKDRKKLLTRVHLGQFEVAEPRKLKVAAGDKILIRGRDAAGLFKNGEVKVVREVDAASSEIHFTDGSLLPPDFDAWTYGHALTAYRSQGATAEASLLVLGQMASQSLEHRQFYVGSTRHRGSHSILVADKRAILSRITRPNQERELATEFASRHHLSPLERIVPRPVRRWHATLQHAWRAMAARVRESRKINQGQTP